MPDTITAMRSSFAARLAPHRPVLVAARTRLLRYTGNVLDGAACMALAATAGLAHVVGAAHGLAGAGLTWPAAAYWAAYLASWVLFTAAASQSLAFGLALLLAYFSADLVGSNAADELMLLALVAVAARACLVALQVGQGVAVLFNSRGGGA